MSIESKFGWLLSGPTPKIAHEKILSTFCQIKDKIPGDLENSDLNESLEKFWEIDKIPEQHDDDETEVQNHFQETITLNRETNRYNVRLPWKDNKKNLPSNFQVAKKRLSNLQHTLKRKDSELIYKYDKQLLDQLKKGFIEKVDDPATYQGVIHYIPHFPVFKESTTTAMRIVYDASAHISP